MIVLKNCKYGTMLYDTKDTTIGMHLNEYAEYSEGEVKLFADCINSGDIVVDVGANIGAHTLVFARLANINGKVYAFEPQKNNYYTLCGNIVINHIENTFAYQNAVGNSEESVKFPEVSTRSSHTSGTFSVDKDYKDFPCYDVKIIKLDDCIKTCNFIKIDTEFYSFEVLQGAKNLIKHSKPFLYIEYANAEEFKNVYNFLLENDYIVYDHVTSLYNINNFSSNKHNILINNKQQLLVSYMLFAHHKSITIDFLLDKHGLVLCNTDTLKTKNFSS